jgi:hypothetical protein
LLRFDAGMRLATRLMADALNLSIAIPLNRYLLRPTHAHQKTACQLLKRFLTLIVGRQKLTA